VVAVIIVLAVAVLVLAAWLWASRSALSAATIKATELGDRLEATEREAAVAQADLADSRERVERERERALTAEAATATALQRAEAAEAATMNAEVARLDAEARADKAEAEAAAGAALDPMGLWALETVRLDRVWRDLVVPDPTQASPLAETSDPSRSGIEIQAGSLREQSGVSIEVVWKVDDPLAPATGALLVRAAEELLAVARAADSATLTAWVEGGDLVMSLVCDPAVALPPHLHAALDAAGLRPSVDGEGITVRTDTTGAG
jgi:hypothetical protein